MVRDAEEDPSCALVLKKMGAEPKKLKALATHINMEEVKRTSKGVSSSPLILRKTSSAKYNCLCSPTTHVGSFRCRKHRSVAGGLTRNGMSVGSKLSELASVHSQLSELTSLSSELSLFEHKQTRLCDLHA